MKVNFFFYNFYHTSEYRSLEKKVQGEPPLYPSLQTSSDDLYPCIHYVNST